MNLIEFFGLKIKPRLTSGKGMWNPVETCRLQDGLCCIRDKDVNFFLLPIDDRYIAIDSGYKRSENAKNGMERLEIDPQKVKAVFLTHLDIDHAGGVDTYSINIFPNATVYLSTEEEKYLKREYFRKKVLFHNCQLPIHLDKGYKTTDDGESIEIGKLKIITVFAPGHTLGHTAYFVPGFGLFSGDCIISGDEGGYGFYDFWNANNVLNLRNLPRLNQFCKKNNIQTVITSHSGILDTETAFLHTDTTPKWKEKGFCFCKTAPKNPYSV